MHPDICEDENLAAISAYAERTFVRLWTHLDDRGRGKDNALLLVAQLYPLTVEMTAERVEKDLCELAQAGLLQRYMVDGKKYLCAKPEAWSRYQKPKHPTPSKIPPPPDLHQNGGSPTPALPQPFPESLHGVVDGGGVGDGDGVTPNTREPRGNADPPHGPPVDNPGHPLARRANAVAHPQETPDA